VKIRYTAASPKAGIEEHLNNQTAATLIAAGFAVHVRYENFVDFMNNEHRTGSDPSNVNPMTYSGVEWSCSGLPTNATRTVIWRKSGGEVTRIENEQQAVQLGCPEAVLKQFRELVAARTGGVNYNEVAQHETAQQIGRDSREAGTWKTLMRKA
jgi:hypothetical protein